IIRVHFIWHYGKLHTLARPYLRQGKLGGSFACPFASRVTIEAYYRAVSHMPKPVQLPCGNCGAKGSDSFMYPRHIEGDNIHIALNGDNAVFFESRLPCQMLVVKHIAF